jgi:small subunit ribosomal protein S8
MKENIARILKTEGYITNYEVEMPGENGQAFSRLRVINKFNNRVPALTGLRRVSKPGLRRYVASTEIPRVLGGLGISILSTPRGVLSGREAKKQNVGGELLAFVW